MRLLYFVCTMILSQPLAKTVDHLVLLDVFTAIIYHGKLSENKSSA